MVGINVNSISDTIEGALVANGNDSGKLVAHNSVEQNIQNKILKLSKNGKNVAVFMLDMAMGSYIPYFMNEKPELKDAFAGFTHYTNTISYGAHTLFGAPAIFGGYEYTPAEINIRNQEPLVKKHNEALKVLPVLFGKEGFSIPLSSRQR